MTTPRMHCSWRRATSAALALLASTVGLVLADAATAQDFAAADSEIDSRLKSSLAELSRTRDKIAKEKIPLSRSLSSFEDQVLKLRRERDALWTERDNRGVDLNSLRRVVESLEKQEDFIDSRLNEFVRDFESRLDISELASFEPITSAARLADKDASQDAAAKRQKQVAVVQAAIDRLRNQLGGHVFPGEALGPDGVLTKGKFVTLGPTVFYASDDGSVTGLVENQLNAADPVVVPLPSTHDAGIVEVAASGIGSLPLDATLGKALKIERARKGIGDYVRDGGAVGYVIIALGFASLLLTAFKAREILAFETASPAQVDTVLTELSKGNRDAAAWNANQVDGISGEMLAIGVEHADDKRSLVEELLFEKILKVRPVLERYLPFLAITAAAAPLLGLLGTVIGMIRTFQLITIFGTGDAKSLSSGISEALITTALGLIVAIPTLILHGALSRMAKRKLGLLEELSVAFVNGAAAIRHRSDRTRSGAE